VQALQELVKLDPDFEKNILLLLEFKKQHPLKYSLAIATMKAEVKIKAIFKPMQMMFKN